MLTRGWELCWPSGNRRVINQSTTWRRVATIIHSIEMLFLSHDSLSCNSTLLSDPAVLSCQPFSPGNHRCPIGFAAWWRAFFLAQVSTCLLACPWDGTHLVEMACGGKKSRASGSVLRTTGPSAPDVTRIMIQASRRFFTVLYHGCLNLFAALVS